MTHTNFHPRTFSERFVPVLQRKIRHEPIETRERIWRAMAVDAERIQRAIEEKYAEARHGNSLSFSLNDIIKWITDNWLLILQILIALLPLILAGDELEMDPT